VIVLKSRERVDLVRFAPAGTVLLADTSRGARLWREFRNGSKGEAVGGLPRPISQLAFVSGGTRIIGADEGLVLYDIGSGAVTRVPLATSRVTRWPDVTVSPDGTRLLVTEYTPRADPYHPGGVFFSSRSADDPRDVAWRREIPFEYGPVAFMPGGREYLVRQSGNMTIGGGWRYVLRAVATGDELRR
jgi:hypothetical protein